jgi:hypothetical protein
VWFASFTTHYSFTIKINSSNEFVMQKHFEKGKKETRRPEERDNFRDDSKKKKLKQVEKTKYRQKSYESEEEDA